MATKKTTKKKKLKPKAAAKRPAKPAKKAAASSSAKVQAKPTGTVKAASKPIAKAPPAKIPTTQSAAKAVPPVKGKGAKKTSATLMAGGGVATEPKFGGEGFDEDVAFAEDLSPEEKAELGLEDEAEEEGEDTEGPPPWWKDDPTGIEKSGEDAETRAEFDDSDEWSEDDEDWERKDRGRPEEESFGEEEEDW